MTRLSRRSVLKTAAAASVALPFAGMGGRLVASAQDGKNSVTWVSPRGTLEVFDDYGYWVAKHLGYFGDIQTEMQPGIAEATSGGKAVAEKQADMSFVSPGVFSALVEAGTGLVSVWHQVAQDTFDFAVAPGSGLTSVAQLEGKRVAVGDPGWSLITDPMFVQAGIDPASIVYVPAGATWAQAVDQGNADAALTWEGLRAQWGSIGLEYEYILGKDWSKFPSNSFQIRQSDYDDPALTDLYTNYLKGWAMGLEFAYLNPRAAAQITMAESSISASLNESFPDKAVAVESLWQNAEIFRGDFATRGAWGIHDFASWQSFFDVLVGLGQVTNPIVAEDVCKNGYIDGANAFDHDAVKADALAFVLEPVFAAVGIPEGAGLTDADFTTATPAS